MCRYKSKSNNNKTKRWIIDTINNSQIEKQKPDINEEITDKVHIYLDKYYDPTRALLDVLIDWGDNHATKLPRNKETEKNMKLIVDKLMEYGADVNHPNLIFNLYQQVRDRMDHWYYPTKEIKYLISNGADPNTLLYYLWQAEPSFGIESFHNHECEISVLIDAGAKFTGCTYLCKYVSMPWESNYKTDFILNPLKNDMNLSEIYKNIKKIFSKGSNYYLIDYMINHGADPNSHNGELLKVAINNYLFYSGYQSISSKHRIIRRTKSLYDESNILKLLWLQLVFMLKYSSFEYVCQAYNYINTIVPSLNNNYSISITSNIDKFRNSIKMAIDIICPSVSYKRKWAALVIQRAWKNAISNPKYTICSKRLNNEFSALLQLDK